MILVSLAWLLPHGSGCAKPESPTPPRIVEANTWIRHADRIRQYGTIHQTSRPLILKGSGQHISEPFRIPPAITLETAFGMAGGLYHQARPVDVDKTSIPPCPVTFSLFFEPLGGGDAAELLSETLNAGAYRNDQWWQKRRIDLKRWAGSSGRFRFHIKVHQPQELADCNARPVWAENRFITTGSDRQGKLILVVSADTLRADALGCYGYNRWTSPHLDCFSRDCLEFSCAYATSPWTLPSHMSLVTSTYPNVHRMEDYKSPPLSPEILTLAELLTKHGYITASFVDGGFINPFSGFHRGFSLFDFRGGGIRENRTRALDWILDHPGDDRFVLLHFYDIHSPYTEKLEGREFASSQPPEAYDLIKLNDIANRSEEAARYLHDLYDEGVAYADHQFAHFLAGLRQAGLYEQATIFFLSDHGEEFREHGRLGHQSALFQESLAVPLLLKLPGGNCAGKLSSIPVSLVDIMPTILALEGIENPQQTRGESLLALADSSVESRTVFSQTIIGGNQEALIDRHFKFIHRGEDGATLYDLVQDPGERLGESLSRLPLSASYHKKLLLEHAWQRPGLHFWFGGLSGNELVQITVQGKGFGRGFHHGNAVSFFADVTAPTISEKSGGVWKASLRTRGGPCGLVVSIRGDPPKKFKLSVRVEEDGKTRELPLFIPRQNEGSTLGELVLREPTEKARGEDFARLADAEEPVCLVQLHVGPPQAAEASEMDENTLNQLKQLGYLD